MSSGARSRDWEPVSQRAADEFGMSRGRGYTTAQACDHGAVGAALKFIEERAVVFSFDLLAGIFVPANEGVGGTEVMVILTLVMVAVVVWIAGGILDAYELAKQMKRSGRPRRRSGATAQDNDHDAHSPRGL